MQNLAEAQLLLQQTNQKYDQVVKAHNQLAKGGKKEVEAASNAFIDVLDWQFRIPYAKSKVDWYTYATPQQLWEDRFLHAKTQQEKLSLLQEAWNKSMDVTLSEDQRSAWRSYWNTQYTEETKKSLIEKSMPNPYAPDTRKSISCTKIGIITDCTEQ